MQSRRGILATGLLAGLAVGCRGRRGSGKPKVAVSIFPLYDLARRIAGDRLDVVLVLPPGRSEHSFDPTPREMARIAGARLALGVGLGMDEWLARIVRSAGGDTTEIFDLGPQLDPRDVSGEDVGEDAADEARDAQDAGAEHHEHGPKDPHVWLDPLRMVRAAELIARKFTQLDPAGAAGFAQRSAVLERSLRMLDAEIAQHRAGWTRTKIVTFHGSMSYFAVRYHLQIVAVVEPFPGREPTARYLAEVLRALENAGAAALFSEPQLDRRPAQVIADQSHLPLFEIDPVGGVPGRDSYELLMRHNVSVLDRALR
ncbi:MAG: metal ABC transporter substrate-binding protein [Deltaproteobacteria bacterium]|nr:metal ABC transporter substrate-binding protein [Deltaproteobacteria bacterium]